MDKHTEDKVILRQLRVTDLLGERIARRVDVSVHLLLLEDLLHLERVVEEAHADGNHHDLPRAEPVGPLAGKVLN